MNQAQFATLVVTSACAILVPSVLALIGIVLNRRDVVALRTDMGRQFDRVDSRLTRIEDDQKQFFTITGRLDGRIEELHRK